MATCSSSLTCINPSASHISLQPQITRQRCIYSDPVFPTDRTCPQQPGCSARLILGHQKGVGVQENSRLGDIRHRCSLRSTAPTNPSADRQGPQASKRRLAERFACRVSEEGKETGVNKQADDGPPYGVLSMLALWLFWAGLAYYAFAIAPNQTPTRDEYFLGKLTLLIQDEYPINQVLLSEFNIMGIWPFIYTALLIPSGRSKNLRPPVWPFASLSMGIGIGGLLPYFALWQQPTPPPPSQEERQKLPLKVLESKIFAGALLAGALGLIGAAVASGPDTWVGFSQYFNESKFIHVMTLDFFCLQLFCPFWLYNDMEFRNWSGRNTWILPLSLLPVLGPALYLLIRPPLPEPTSDGPEVAEAPKPIG